MVAFVGFPLSGYMMSYKWGLWSPLKIGAPLASGGDSR